MSEQDRRFAMNRVSVETGEVEGRDVIVLVVEDVDSGLRMDTILPNSTEVARLVRIPQRSGCRAQGSLQALTAGAFRALVGHGRHLIPISGSPATLGAVRVCRLMPPTGFEPVLPP